MARKQIVFEFWTGFWKQASDYGPSTEDVCHKLPLNALRDRAATQSAPPDLELLVRTFRRAKGAASPDGWKGQEIRHLPVGAIQAFREHVALAGAG